MRAQAQIAVAYGLDSASKPNRLYVTIDGVVVRELDGWNETKASAKPGGHGERREGELPVRPERCEGRAILELCITHIHGKAWAKRLLTGLKPQGVT